MTDFLVEISKNEIAKKIIKSMGIPLTLPKSLKRDNSPLKLQELEGLSVVYADIKESLITIPIAQSLAKAGAITSIYQNENTFKIFNEKSLAWGRFPKFLYDDDNNSNLEPHALIFDATELKTFEELYFVYEFFHKFIKKIKFCGRIIILGRKSSSAKNPIVSGACHALEGFMRSMGKEIGKNGATVQLVYVDYDAEERLEPVLRFLLSYRSSYISGQSINVTSKVKTDLKPDFIRSLDNKAALVTGAARGIGAAIAKSLSREGARVICMDLAAEEEHLTKLSDEINAMFLLCDITEKNSPDIISDFILKKFGGLDIVVHNAGITRDKTLSNMDQKLWDKTLDVNLISLVKVNEKLKSYMKNNGRIVCLSSVTGISGNIGQTNYSASKAGIIGYVKALSQETADKGICVNAIAPGFIETQMTAKIPFITREFARRLCNLSQGGQPQDVAELVTFLSSPGAFGITGEVIRICGGSFIGA